MPSLKDGVKSHQVLAQGGSLPEGESFGVGPLDSVKTGPKPGATVMSESERNAPIGGNQANPKHGDM